MSDRKTADSIVPGLTSANAPRGWDLSQMYLCATCFRLAGPVSADPGEPIRYQRCLCERASTAEVSGGEPERWPRFDFNEAVTLCHCCAIELLESGSRWSVWFCDDCRVRVRRLNQELGFYLIPIGRHSLMGGLKLDGGAASDPAKVEQFVQGFGGFIERIDLLSAWSTKIIEENIGLLGRVLAGI